MDAHSTSPSDGSTIVPDYHGRCLRRALDRKVRALRTMLSVDDDITTELDHVVCRLMKLALKSSKGKQAPPPSRWMQCKMLDLLTLTEKSISRRKRFFIENFPLKTISCGNDESVESIGLSKLKTDDTAANKFLEKYENLMQLSDAPNLLEVEEYIMGEGESTDAPNFLEVEECLMGEGEFTDTQFPNFLEAQECLMREEFNFTKTGFPAEPENGYLNYGRGKVYKPVKLVNGDDSSLDITVTWVEEDYLAIVPYPDNKSAAISSSDHSTSFGARYRYKKPYKTFNNYVKYVNGSNNQQRIRFQNKVFDNNRVQNTKDDNEGSDSNTNLPRKVRRRNAANYRKFGLKSKKERKKLQPTPSNPIPGGFIELCQPKLTTESVGFNFAMKKDKSHNVANESNCNIAATKESLLLSIVMDDMEETIALRRSIGTDADMDLMVCEQEVLMESALNVETNDSLNNLLHIATENVHSQTIFLYDVNEPSTSKGVRHLSTDVQCGPDTLTPCCATVASKIAMSAMLSKNTKCTRFAKKSTIVPLAVVKKDINEQKKLLHKNYLPLYLKKRKPILDEKSLNQNLDSVQIAKDLQKPKSKEMLSLPLTMSDPEDIKSSLIKFSDKPQENVSYVVFRNEIENQNRSATDCQTTDNSARKKNCSSRRSSSPTSQNSSACSTPDSVVTVRTVTTRSRASTRRHSASSNKSSLGNTEPETATPVRNRKFTKRGKNTKKSDEKDHDKENNPESSKNSFFGRGPVKTEKTTFKGRNKNVYMARVTNDSSPSHNNDKLKQNQTPNKSCIKIPAVDSKDDVEKKKRPLTATLAHETSITKSSYSKCDVLSEEKQSDENPNPNKLHPVESYNEHINVKENTYQIQKNTSQIPQNIFQQQQNTSQITQSTSQIQVNTPKITTNNSTSDSDLNVIDDKILSQWLDTSSHSLVVSSEESSIFAAMKHIVEDQLDFIEQSCPKYYDLSNSDTLNLVIEEFNNQNMEDALSVSSFKTAMTHENDFNNTIKSDYDSSYNITFNTTLGDDSLQSLLDITPPTTNLDLLSFKSLTSVSRYSELFLVDGQPSQPTQAPPAITSFKEIFERKDQQIVQSNPPGPLAIQAFSGFSMNVAPVAGDQPDYVNLVDSETGSVAADFARQVTSEEVFVSGRSSSYESCVIDEDADVVVPNWLFQLINQQHYAEEQEPLQQQLLPMPVPAILPHEQFDMNGNVADGLGAAAGAGDGRGMHSDHSQDSSGRGTSLSSSDTSSGQQSQAILVDPSAFTAQFELLRDPIGSSIAVTTLVVPITTPDNSFRAGEGLNIQNEMGTSRNVPRYNPLLAASDADADVSSLDTDDVPDSSDN